MKSNITIKGLVHFQIKKNGIVTDSWSVPNIITNAGKAQIALLATDSAAVPFTYIAIGTSSTSPAASQTALGTEISTNGFARASATVSRITTSVTNDTIQVVKTWTASGTHTNVQEVGIFNDASAGVMLGRTTFSAKSFISGDQFTITYTVQFS